MNTRTYFRNSALAFPRSADYACSIERVRKPKGLWWVAGWAVAIYSLLVISRIVLGG